MVSEVDPHRYILLIRDPGTVPELSLQDCTVLEKVLLSVVGPTTSLLHIPALISSITSPRFKSLILKLRTTEQGERDAFQADLVDRISDLDAPLSYLGRVASKRNQKVSLVLLGREPEFLAQGLVDFQEVGCIWAGDEVGENSYSWTFASPKNSRTKRYRICILDRLLRREK